MRWSLLLILLALLGGCLDGSADDSIGDDGADDTDIGDDGSDGDAVDDTNETREVVEITVTWTGVYRANGAYDQTSVTAPANSTVKLTFVNEDPAFGHDLVIDEFEGAATTTVGACTTGTCASKTVEFDVGAPGSYKFYCSIPGHRNGGMEGDFIVA